MSLLMIIASTTGKVFQFGLLMKGWVFIQFIGFFYIQVINPHS